MRDRDPSAISPPSDAAQRRAEAALCLTSAPPADLLARIRERRRANERVDLPVPPDDVPQIEPHPRVDAALSLLSAPPDDLLARTLARRAAGERVVLVPPEPAPRRRS